MHSRSVGPPRNPSKLTPLLGLPLLLALGPLIEPPPASAGACVSSATTLCLGSDRYQVRIDWQSPTAQGQGQVFSALSGSTGFFTLDDGAYVDSIVRVVDACGINDHSWVFFADLSQLGLDLSVTDLSVGSSQQYSFGLGSVHHPVADTQALPCTPPPESGARAPSPDLATKGAITDPLLVDGRFRVTVDWDSGTGSSGVGNAIELTDGSVTFWYFSPANPELLLKIEPDTDTGFYRLVASPIANVEQTITVVDTCSGSSQVYLNPQGTASTIVDEELESIDCADRVFEDGFESGNLDPWSGFAP